MWTTPFERFVAPARARPQLWRLVAGLVVAVGFWALGIAALLAATWALVGGAGLADWLQRLVRLDTPTAVLVMLASFAGLFAGPLVAARLLHGRSARGLFGPGLGRGFATGAIVTALVFAAAALALPVPLDTIPNLPLPLFLQYLPLALVGIAMQTGAEEVMFRGYLQSQLAARFRHPLIWMGLPALAFGSLHFDPAGAGANALWLVGAATLFGLVAADLTRVTGGIGAAWGVHFVNNASAILLLSVEGSLSGLSLRTTAVPVEALSGTVLAQDMLITVIVWVCLRLWYARTRRRPPA